MFDQLLASAFDSGGEVFVYMKGFSSPLRGRIQDIQDEFFTLFQNGKFGTILWAFRFSDILSCGLLVGPPIGDLAEVGAESNAPTGELPYRNDSDN